MIVLCAAIAIMCLVSFLELISLFHLPESGRLQHIIQLILLLAGTCLNLAILVYYFKAVHVPATQLEDTLEIYRTGDLNSFSIALADLAGGNLTSRVDASLKSIPGGRLNLMKGLFSAFNKLLYQLNESAMDFNTATAVPCARLCYVGADSFLEGKRCGEMMGKFLGGKGHVAILLDRYSIIGHNLRRKGFQNMITTNFPGITVVDIQETLEDMTVTFDVTMRLLRNNPNLDGIYSAGGTTACEAARAIRESGRSGKVKMVTHDLADSTMNSLVKGDITGTISQNPYAQGHDPLIYLYNFLVDKKSPFIRRKLTSLEIVTKENYDLFWNVTNGAIVSQKEKGSLAEPIDNSTNTFYRIGVVLPDDTGFWNLVRQGVKAATEELASRKTEVQCVIPEAIRKRDWSANAFMAAVDTLINDGCQAVALPIFDRSLVPMLNAVIDKGIMVATFIAEPASLRGMVESITEHAQHLFELSEDLAAGSYETSQATAQINKTMETILSGTKEQLSRLSSTDGDLNALKENILQVINDAIGSAKAAQLTAETAQIGQNTVLQSYDAMQILKKKIVTTTGIINTLNDNSLKIKDIIFIIEDITSQTNVLAINAAIQASHAGNEGKGFSIIASEIRKLAEASIAATNDIRLLIETILGGVSKANESIKGSMKEVGVSTDMSEKAKEVLIDIVNASGTNEKLIGTINSAINEMQVHSADVMDEMLSFSKINNENGNSIERITNSISEMNVEVNSLSNMSRQLADMARSMEDMLSQFTSTNT
jgi:methyl-accepting chemotaxis protein